MLRFDFPQPKQAKEPFIMQTQINSNFHERLSDLEVQQQIMTTFLSAVIETHPSPQLLKDKFTLASERILASAIQKPLPDSWFE